MEIRNSLTTFTLSQAKVTEKAQKSNTKLRLLRLELGSTTALAMSQTKEAHFSSSVIYVISSYIRLFSDYLYIYIIQKIISQQSSVG